MVDIFPYLEMVRDKIKEIEKFKSVKIGLEKGADKAVNCPFVRIIQKRDDYSGVIADTTIDIVVGFDIKNDYELLYKEVNATLLEIKEKLLRLPFEVELLSSIHDEDRLTNLKAGVLQVKLLNLVERCE